MANDLLDYPRGQISLGTGKLAQATMTRMTYTQGRRLKHTIRRSPSGFVTGNHEVSGSISTIIDEEGPERDYFALVKSGAQKQFRYEIPGQGVVVVGVFSQVSAEIPTDDAVSVSADFVGKLTVS